MISVKIWTDYGQNCRYHMTIRIPVLIGVYVKKNFERIGVYVMCSVNICKA